MKKQYFGILFLCIIIGVALSFAVYIRTAHEGLTTKPTYPVNEFTCSNYRWSPSYKNEPSSNFVEWAIMDLSGKQIQSGIPFPRGYTPTCDRAKVAPCPDGTNWVCIDPSNIVNGQIKWVKINANGEKLDIISTSPTTIPLCKNPVPPTPTPTPTPNILPPWKTFSLGILNETQQNINNIIKAESNKIAAVSLK